MDDNYLLKRGYKKYDMEFDDDIIVGRFKKTFDNETGRKYLIEAVKYTQEHIPLKLRDKDGESFKFYYEVYIFKTDNKGLGLYFHNDWVLEEVEKFMEDMFDKMNLSDVS